LGKSLGMSRPWLHAAELNFAHPVTGKALHFEAPYPADLTRSLALLSDAVLP
jgi:23S rRNA pseudouridine1911/1915/1917 synthase